MKKGKLAIALAVIGFLGVATGIYLVFRQKKLTMGSKEANDALKDMQMY